MRRFVSIGSIADVNPKVPEYVSTALNKTATFLPMAAVSEAGRITAPEEALIGEVIKGYKYFEEGDTLLAKITPCMENGKAVLVEGVPHPIGFGSTEFHVIRPRADIDKRYLFYMVWNPSFRYVAARNMTGTAGQRRVPTNFIRRFKIPLPPLDEQRRIAAILDKADAVRRKRKEAIALTEDLLRSAFLEMFGDPVINPKEWNTATLGEVLIDIESGWSPKCDPREAKEEEWGVLKLGAVTYGNYNETEHKTLLPEGVSRPEIEVKQGDLLFSRKNTYELVGASAHVYQTRPRLMLSDLIFRLCCKTDVDSVYLWQTLSQKTVRSQLTRLASGSSGSMPNISKRRLRTLTVPIPPLSLQQKYRSVAQRLWINQQRQERNCKLIEDLFNSLLQRAFRGDL